MRSRVLAGAIVWMMLEAGCSDEGAPPGPASPQAASASDASTPSAAASSPASASAESASQAEPRSEAELAAAGRSVYNANCIACHAMDPRQDGALGPAVAGSSLDLIEARVMRAEYPQGYTPKRATRVMVPMPHLKDRLPELAAYLGSLKS
ncbi:MAG: cytochrome c [Myxococcota bacterium]